MPDSDDEDVSDIHSDVGCGDQGDDERNSGPHGRHHGIWNDNDAEEDIIPEHTETYDRNQYLGLGIATEPGTCSHQPTRSANTSAGDHSDFRSTPPSPLRAFRAPLLFSDIDDAAADEQSDLRTGGSTTQSPRLHKVVTGEEEISQSYVQLSSPLSSLSSLCEGSQQSLVPRKQTSKFHQDLASPGSRNRLSYPSNTVPVDICIENLREAGNFNGRFLRERNPIQLHPYHVEQENYRKILKARGMTPVILAHTQDEARRKSQYESYLDTDSQARESQDVMEPEENRAVDLHWDLGPPSSSQKVTEDGTDSEVAAERSLMDEDEDFPDIHELLHRRTTRQPLVRPLRRLKSYSTNRKVPMSSKIQPRSTEIQHLRGRGDSVFDIPASPPATSSPFTAVAPEFADPVSHAAPGYSKESTPSWLDRNEPYPQEDLALPTPVTSTNKPVPDLILVESASDREDPFAEDLQAPSSSSSSAASVQIRRNGKKIRGVLPASHLRLDQQIKSSKSRNRLNRDSRTVSPAKFMAGRGIALPKLLRNSPSSKAVSMPMFLSDDSDEVDDYFDEIGLMMEGADSELGNAFEQPAVESAEEDDRIDAMLPARKRHIRELEARPRKKSRTGSSLLLRDENGTYSRQAKITDHIERHPKRASTYRNPSRTSGPHGNSSRRVFKGTIRRTRNPPPPRLSILDVADEIGSVGGRLPQFIRIAARTAKYKRGLGRDSPSKKFIRMATREDTIDAQSVLQDWRDCKIQAKNFHPHSRVFEQTSRPPLHEITNNRRTRMRSPEAKMKPRSHDLKLGRAGRPRKLVLSKTTQRSMDAFVIMGDTATEQSKGHHDNLVREGLDRRHQERPRFQVPLARPGQLETSEVAYSRPHSAIAFRATKRSLDVLYRSSRKFAAPQANLQLSRFLAEDEDVFVQPSTYSGRVANPDVVPDNAAIAIVKKASRGRKRPPQRIDASAALYRQPSEPLILEFLQPASTTKFQNVADQGSKLLGLGELGTNYPCHFDISPLHSGVFFHENTFIGSGRLSEALKHPRATLENRPHISFWVANKAFRWGPWDENVSSEVGVCFDWLLDQLIIKCSPETNSAVIDVVGAVTFVVDYVQHHISFSSSQNRQDFLSRMFEILQEFSSRLSMNPITVYQKQVQRGTEVLARCVVLVMQMLQISRQDAEQPSMRFKLEHLLQSIARRCVGLLVLQSLDGIRKLYDDLQYLSFRQRGIRSDQYAVQAWVIIRKVLDVAQIPRGSFWDVTNSELVTVDMMTADDARTMEKLWYSMFSLLPLCEFNEFGVIIPGHRQTASFDNWSLPQQMLKRVFAIYTSRPRQSPSFNDYCRTIVGRCHHLMLEWGWWKCRGVIGTLFDFFASQNLAHLRNEEVYTSPRFLEELNFEPSLAIEPEDRCFHIFLKILALAIKHMHQAGDTKDIRNLVARVLPNHGRQYPKEEDIQERELASLRNHHDLLCTLYWSAPAGQRRSPDLIELLQKLVIPARSHKAACLINLNAWTNLARFSLTSMVNTSCIFEAYRPIKDWQTSFFSELLQEYLREEMEAQDRAESVPRGDSVYRDNLRTIIQMNRRSNLDILRQSIITMSTAISHTWDVSSLLQAFNGGKFLIPAKRILC